MLPFLPFLRFLLLPMHFLNEFVDLNFRKTIFEGFLDLRRLKTSLQIFLIEGKKLITAPLIMFALKGKSLLFF